MIGQKIVYDDSITAQVSGIVADLDQQGNTDFNFQEFISLNTILKNTSLQKSMYWTEWGSTTSDQQLYLQLGSNTSVASVEKRLKDIFDKNLGEDAKKNHYTWTYRLQPLEDIHFNHYYGTFDSPVASKSMLTGSDPGRCLSDRDRLYQFHQPHHGQCGPAGQRNRCAQNHGQFQGPIDLSVSGRNFSHHRNGYFTVRCT